MTLLADNSEDSSDFDDSKDFDDSSDSAFAALSIDYALIAVTLLLLLPPSTQPIVATLPLLLPPSTLHSNDFADCSDFAFAAKKICSKRWSHCPETIVSKGTGTLSVAVGNT